MRHKNLTAAVLGVIFLFAGIGSAYAFGSYLSAPGTGFNALYPNAGSISNCGLCHTNASNPDKSWNAFGTAYKNNGSFAAIENTDSDGDGFTNKAEITANPPTYPGDPASHPAPAVVTCTSFTYSAWSACQSNSTQTRTVASSSPAGCTGGTPVLTQACTYIPPVSACTSFTYSDWSACQPGNTQTRTMASASPAGCTGSPAAADLTQACVYTQPPTGSNSVNVNSARGTGQVKIETMTGGTNLTNVTAVSDTDSSVNQHEKPSGFAFNDGLFKFRVNGVAVGGTVQVKLTLPAAVPAGSKVYKIKNDGFHDYDHATISGNTLTLTITDGGSGDADGVANGIIDDPVGVASPAAAAPQTPAADSGSGGGGCSIGHRPNTGTAYADAAVLLMPLLVMGGLHIARRRKSRQQK